MESHKVVSLCKNDEKQRGILHILTLLHSKWPKLHWVLAVLNAIGLTVTPATFYTLLFSKLQSSWSFNL